MELPMVIVLVQRLGPATGTATSGAQGDITLLNGMLSGGYSIPVLSTSEAKDCWEMAGRSSENRRWTAYSRDPAYFQGRGDDTIQF